MRILLALLTSGAAMLATANAATPPSMRGALWWMPYQAEATAGDYERFVEKQRAVGFDLLWICNTPALLQKAQQNEKDGTPYDPLELVFRVADEKGMRVIVDLPQCGWYGKATVEELHQGVTQHLETFWRRYGKHRCLLGWYLNYEINPLSPDEKEQSAWWRKAWREVTASCHRLAPGLLVTISPFFIMDDQNRRGFPHLTPREYAAWWEETLRQTRIDLLMLQDSGAEHLGFFSLADREPFLAAMQAACRRANAHFWVNVESAEADVADWDAFLLREREGKVPWRVVPIEQLAAKLALASQYGEAMINWGYFPYLAPAEVGVEPTAAQAEAYRAYQRYLQEKQEAKPAGGPRE